MCYYALGDVELMRKGFMRLLAVPLPDGSDDDDGDDSKHDDDLTIDKLELSRVRARCVCEARLRAGRALRSVVSACRTC